MIEYCEKPYQCLFCIGFGIIIYGIDYDIDDKAVIGIYCNGKVGKKHKITIRTNGKGESYINSCGRRWKLADFEKSYANI